MHLCTRTTIISFNKIIKKAINNLCQSACVRVPERGRDRTKQDVSSRRQTKNRYPILFVQDGGKQERRTVNISAKKKKKRKRRYTVKEQIMRNQNNFRLPAVKQNSPKFSFSCRQLSHVSSRTSRKKSDLKCLVWYEEKNFKAINSWRRLLFLKSRQVWCEESIHSCSIQLYIFQTIKCINFPVPISEIGNERRHVNRYTCLMSKGKLQWNKIIQDFRVCIILLRI